MILGNFVLLHPQAPQLITTCSILIYYGYGWSKSDHQVLVLVSIYQDSILATRV